jgi:hypothetical protein
MRAALARHWRLGTVVFLIALILCGVLIWKRQTRHNLVSAFSVRTISQEIRLPSSVTITPENIVTLLKLSLEDRSLRGSISHQRGTFTITVASIPADSTHQVERGVSKIYQQLVARLGDMDPTLLSEQLEQLDARLDLIARTRNSTGLSAYERYALEDQALTLEVRRKDVRDQLDVVSNPFSPLTSQLYRAEHMADGVLLLLGMILSGFMDCAAMVLAAALSSRR